VREELFREEDEMEDQNGGEKENKEAATEGWAKLERRPGSGE